jgi:hypothetical protein
VTALIYVTIPVTTTPAIMVIVAVTMVAIIAVAPVIIVPPVTVVMMPVVGRIPVRVPQWKIETVVRQGVRVVAPVKRIVPSIVIGIAIT